MKVARSFRLEEITLDRLERLVMFYNLQDRSAVDLPGSNKVVNRTDVLEFLINSKFEKLMLEGKDL